MPLTLIEPRPGKTPYFAVRGHHLGIYIDRSTKARNRSLARKILRKWEREIERGEFTEPQDPTFASAALNYMKAGGERRFVTPLLNHFGEIALRRIDQASIDAAALALYPNATPATRNRQVYSQISAILKHAGADFKIRRPKGSRGRVITAWLWPDQAFKIFEAAESIDAEFALLLQFLCYTGPRLSEALRMRCDDVKLDESFAYIGRTKNGDPRPVHLPPHLVASLANHPRGTDRKGERVFRFHKGGALYYLLESTRLVASGLAPLPRIKIGRKPTAAPHRFDWVTFHTFCHTWATWMRRYAGLDELGLVETGRWRDRQSASRYAHGVVGEAARKADLLPTPNMRTRADAGH